MLYHRQFDNWDFTGGEDPRLLKLLIEERHLQEQLEQVHRQIDRLQEQLTQERQDATQWPRAQREHERSVRVRPDLETWPPPEPKGVRIRSDAPTRREEQRVRVRPDIESLDGLERVRVRDERCDHRSAHDVRMRDVDEPNLLDYNLNDIDYDGQNPDGGQGRYGSMSREIPESKRPRWRVVDEDNRGSRQR